MSCGKAHPLTCFMKDTVQEQGQKTQQETFILINSSDAQVHLGDGFWRGGSQNVRDQLQLVDNIFAHEEGTPACTEQELPYVCDWLNF
eukprot:403942-Pelagomonas_calceolata.AAC.2